MLPDDERGFFRSSLVSMRPCVDCHPPCLGSLLWLLFQATLACYREERATLTWGTRWCRTMVCGGIWG